MIVKAELSRNFNSQIVFDYLNSELVELSVTPKMGGLSKRVFLNLNSNKLTLEYKEGYVELLGFSRIDGNPLFNLFNISLDSFLSNRKNRINSLFDDKIIINRVSQFVKREDIQLIKALDDHKFIPPTKTI